MRDTEPEIPRRALPQAEETRRRRALHQELAVRAGVALLMLAFNELFTMVPAAKGMIRLATLLGFLVNLPYYVAARSGRLRRLQAWIRMVMDVAFITAGLYAAATVVTWAVHEPRPGADWGAAVGPLLAGALVNASVLAWGMFVRARRQLVLSLAERARRAEAEQQARAQEARRLERERIAREMHDVLAHRISLLSLHAGALEFHPDAPAEEVARAAGVIRQSAHQALQDLRRVISVLRWPADGAAPPPPQPTLADLPALVDDSRQAGTRVRLDSRLDDLEAAPADLGRDAYRVVQEALTNARKHAPACAVWLVVEGGPGAGLTVEARNRLPLGGAAGPVAPLVPGAGLGLVGLTERVELAGGRLEHGPTADGHFRLWAWLPWPA